MKTCVTLFALLIALTPWISAEPLEVGTKAPDLKVALEDGSQFALAKAYKEGPVLVYFYPKSFTGGCTKQACNLRDNFSDVDATGMTIFGVSADDVETQARFKSEHTLPFHLIADTENELSKAFGVPVNEKGYPRRQSFLVVDGKIAWRDLKATPVTQAQDALAALKSLE